MRCQGLVFIRILQFHNPASGNVVYGSEHGPAAAEWSVLVSTRHRCQALKHEQEHMFTYV